MEHRVDIPIPRILGVSPFLPNIQTHNPFDHILNPYHQVRYIMDKIIDDR